MKIEDVVVGVTYLTRIGGQLAPVIVRRPVDDGGKRLFEVARAGRPGPRLQRSAAALRPMKAKAPAVVSDAAAAAKTELRLETQISRRQQRHELDAAKAAEPPYEALNERALQELAVHGREPNVRARAGAELRSRGVIGRAWDLPSVAAERRLLTAIAKEHLHLDSLETRDSDRADFHDCHVAGIAGALEAAYAAGLKAGGK